MDDDEQLEIINSRIINSPIKKIPKIKKEESKMKCENNQDYESEVILFVDNREKKNIQTGNYLFDKLTTSAFRTELKSLPLGDFIWVLRVKIP